MYAKILTQVQRSIQLYKNDSLVFLTKLISKLNFNTTHPLGDKENVSL